MVKEGTTAWKAIEALNNKTAMINAASETAMVDDGVGAVMQKLKELGMDHNTIVIYTSDQGASYGHHGLFGNTSWSFPFTAHNINMQIPLIVRHPGRIPRGIESSGFINQFDLFPTLLGYIGMGDKRIANTPGKDFSPMLLGKDIDKWDDVAFFEFVTVRVIRTPEWKYMKRLDDDEPNTLYDLRSDPEERVNLIHHPAFMDVARELDRRLTTFFDRYSDKTYDLWKGGTAKGILLQKYYGRNDIFTSRFPDWKEPSLEKAKHVFTDIR